MPNIYDQAQNIDLNEPSNAIARQRLMNREFLANQNQLTSDFLGKFSNVIAGQGTTQQAAQRIGEDLGLPQLRQNAFGLQQSLIDIPELYKSGTRGFDVNANQLGRIIATKQAELAPYAERATAQSQFAEGELGTRLGYLQNDWNRQLLPLNSEQAFLADRFAREVSVFSAEDQRELDALLGKINAGVTYRKVKEIVLISWPLPRKHINRHLRWQELKLISHFLSVLVVWVFGRAANLIQVIGHENTRFRFN